VRIPAFTRNARAHRRAQLPDKPARNRVHHLYVSRPLPAPRSLTDACAVGAVTSILVVLTLWHRVRVRRVFAANMARTDATGLPPGWVRGPGLARPAQAHVVGPMPAYMAPVSLFLSSPLSPSAVSSIRVRFVPPFGSHHRPVSNLLSFVRPDRIRAHTVHSHPAHHQTPRTCTRPHRRATSRRASRSLRPRARRLHRGRRRGSRTRCRDA
jgi:hypothetical protein